MKFLTWLDFPLLFVFGYFFKCCLPRWGEERRNYTKSRTTLPMARETFKTETWKMCFYHEISEVGQPSDGNKELTLGLVSS